MAPGTQPTTHVFIRSEAQIAAGLPDRNSAPDSDAEFVGRAVC